MNRIVVAVAVLSASAASALAADRRVPQQYETIQAAVDAANENDRILISAGTYYENVTVTKNNLRFAGRRVVLDGTSLTGAQNDTFDLTGNGITIEGLVFRNGSTQVRITGDRATIRKCVFRNAGSNGVSITGANATIERSTFVGTSSDSVDVSGSDARVTSCRIVNSGDGGVYVNGPNARVEKCVAQNMVDDAGVEVDGSDAKVIGNRIASCDDNGIDVSGANARVEGNTVTATDSEAIYVSGDNPTVVGNRVSNVSGEDTGIYVTGSESSGGLIEGNTVSDTTEDGIEVYVAGVTVRRNVVQRCGGEDDVAFVLGAQDIVAEDNTAIDADCYGFSVTGDGVTLRRCRSVNAARAGIRVDSRAGVTVEACTVTGSGIAGIENYGTSTTLRNSVFSGNRRDVTNDATYSVFTGNRFRTGGEDTPVFDLDVM